MTFLNEDPKVDRRLLFRSLISPSKILSTILKKDITIIYCSCKGRSVIDSEDLVTFIKDAGIEDVKLYDNLCDSEGLEFYKNVLNSFPRKLIVLACSKRYFRDIADEMNYPLENLYFLEIQELCGLVHDNTLKATEKAKRMIASYIAQNFSQTQNRASGIILSRSKGLETKEIRTLYGRLDLCLSFKKACSSCMNYCPRKAISPNLSTLVDRRLCDVCGICESVCLQEVFYTFPFKPEFELGLDFLLKDSWRTLGIKKGKKILEDSILVFACEKEVKNTFIRMVLAGEKYREEILPLFLPSLSMITLELILQAFNKGAQKVILLGCHSCSPEIKAYVEDIIINCKTISSKLENRIVCSWIKENDTSKLISILEEVFENIEKERFEAPNIDKEYDSRRIEVSELIKGISDKERIPSSKLLPFGFIEIDKETCNLCGKCANSCPTEALKLSDEHVFFDHVKCFGCNICERVCEKKSIKCYQEIRTNFIGKSIKVV
ncbi:MAG: hydrogenase iron-sulfur subunit [Nitrososphaeria archaeon]|nr:hydrogenase iron-sulfur subunit [Nitrososphaeria archaeon]